VQSAVINVTLIEKPNAELSLTINVQTSGCSPAMVSVQT